MNTKTSKSRALVYGVLTILAVGMVIPFVWMLLASFKTSNEVFSIPMKLMPEIWHGENYQEIWKKIPLLTFFVNTTKLTLITTVIQVLTSCFAAYGFAKVKFKGRDILFVIYVTTIAVPWQVYMVPQFALMSKMQLTNSHLGLILMQAFSAFGVFLMRQFMMGIPGELLEAARIDGLNEYGIFARIALPLVKPGIATLIIFTFVNIWNDFMGPMIYINSTELKTIQLGIRMFISQYGADYALIMAASVCSLIPVLIIFMLCQRWFIEGIAAGGVKG
ncbi:L-arabinose transport system permease protein AraQ [Lachnospiraceae bacterium]|jgi:multiple sugar transport system permease protein|nr:carbohydrate ABC transporter permease [Lachnospiraceae bacterium]NBH26115.1 carbohydrate ABC transporter permease [Lachnospiraceae bacterium]GFI15137.1 L-arabinose transport system permease protein AraQ [Lachnospiraceae bacterium]GFI70287.1 L-arabinose transport system permease protein AraQ [Lachnospiraceae bacterium]